MDRRRVACAMIVALAVATSCRNRPVEGIDADGDRAPAGAPAYVPAGEIYKAVLPDGYGVEMPPPVASGGLDDGALREATRPALEGARACYAAGLSGKPGLSGEVRLTVPVGPDGKAGTVEVESDTTGDSRLTGCAADVLAAVEYPGGNAGEVEVTFRFSAPGKGGSR